MDRIHQNLLLAINGHSTHGQKSHKVLELFSKRLHKKEITVFVEMLKYEWSVTTGHLKDGGIRRNGTFWSTMPTTGLWTAGTLSRYDKFG